MIQGIYVVDAKVLMCVQVTWTDTIDCHKTRSSSSRLSCRRISQESSKAKRSWNGSGTTSQRSQEISQVLNAGVSVGS